MYVCDSATERDRIEKQSILNHEEVFWLYTHDETKEQELWEL